MKSRNSKMTKPILDALASGEKTTREIAQATGIQSSTVAVYVNRLVSQGKVIRVSEVRNGGNLYFIWALASATTCELERCWPRAVAQTEERAG